MKRKEVDTLRAKEVKELEKTAVEKKRELLKAKVDMSVAKEKNLKKVKNLKHEIAQILTIIKEKTFTVNEDGQDEAKKAKKEVK
ncbi:50S ribosomal protein L29 [Candidatus Woesebacteria bacterium GWA1_41_8]|jgi:ribosomal protein L29|uniref:Large ribosomal subunit protein uL29 n=1 Tax=Candidatus Woesebacteria bacterium GWA1_41_8 TaxID=1802471 RepID=A0A1F7WIY6_9BACT|nr:MAG: 50S ribosomal protein L29 [Candidatus Woesebacteria bacterium GWA1_41_8]